MRKTFFFALRHLIDQSAFGEQQNEIGLPGKRRDTLDHKQKKIMVLFLSQGSFHIE
jgi:hypothetical protein